MNTFAAWSHERVPGPTEAEKLADNLARDIEVIIRCATGPKHGKPALARGNMVMLSAESCRKALVALLINDHGFTPPDAEHDARLALVTVSEMP